MYYNKRKKLIASDTEQVEKLQRLKLDIKAKSLNEVINFLIAFKEAHELKKV